ncbi:proteasome assembly chaperone family protein [Marisediminicola senii]|uniref:proteasome assembly chaperone family protein n=1 Tax=Marisediminicola senii TaxID=2711233 RepID=UPI001F29CD1A|nr:PAC2 family protein [Marisediminicola senii]
MADSSETLKGRLLVVAFEGWNDAGEAASGAVRTLKQLLDLYPIAEVESEDYFDYQFNRPTVTSDDDGNRLLVWPSVTIYGPTSVLGQGRAGQVGQVEVEVEAEQTGQVEAPIMDASSPAGPAVGDGSSANIAADAQLSMSAANNANIYLMLGTEPSRGWKSFTAEILATVQETNVSAIVMLGAMLADVPHTRPISVFVSSENEQMRSRLGVERSSYEGPVGILSVLGEAAEKAGIPTLSIWASVPHYVHNAPSPKATLALIDKLEEIIDVVIPRGDLVDDAATWESGIDALASEDEDMSNYIEQLEQARDTVDSPEASGEAIAQEFEKYLRRGEEKPDSGGSAGDEPWRPKE